MKIWTLIIICFACLLRSNSYARIGETLTQCEERYGARIRSSDKITICMVFYTQKTDAKFDIDDSGIVFYRKAEYCFFQTQNYSIGISFTNKIADSIWFMKIASNTGNIITPIELSEYEINKFLEANKGDGEWTLSKKDNTNAASRNWRCLKNKQVAYLTDKKYLKITTNSKINNDANEIVGEWEKEKEVLEKF